MGSIFFQLDLDDANAKFGLIFFSLLYLSTNGMNQVCHFGLIRARFGFVAGGVLHSLELCVCPACLVLPAGRACSSLCTSACLSSRRIRSGFDALLV